MAEPAHNEKHFLADLCRQSAETEWLEFKENFADTKAIGEYVSALSNSAMLHEREHAYLVWGVRDGDHVIVGTDFDPYSLKVGNEGFIPWLTRLLEPQTMFRFSVIPVSNELRAVILYIDAARNRPVRFSGEEYIRVGSAKKKLRAHPEHERRLWRLAERETFETGTAPAELREAEVLEKIDFGSYFELLRLPLPPTRSGIINHLAQTKLIERDIVGWRITNLGAVTFAKELTAFPGVARKHIRVVRYAGKNRVQTERSHDGTRGYANGFSGLITYLESLLPREERVACISHAQGVHRRGTRVRLGQDRL